MKGYKITTIEGFTYNNTKWEEGVSHEVTTLGKFCSSSCIHFYRSPLLAVLLNSNQGNFKFPFLLWEGEAEEPIINDNFLKYGTRKFTTIRKIEVPEFNPLQICAFGIFSAREVTLSLKEWIQWSDNWLSGKDRTKESAASAAYYTAYYAAAYAAAYAADYYAYYTAAYAAFYAYYTAAYAAYAAAAAAAAKTSSLTEKRLEELALKAYNFEK